MAAYAALVSLLNNIHAITNHPQLSTCLQNIHIQPLLGKINFLLDFVEGNNYGPGSEEAEDLERRIASAAHAAEDLIESHIVDRIHEENLRWPHLLTFLVKSVAHYAGQSRKPLDLQQINEDMDAIIKEANEFKETGILVVEHQQIHRAEPLTQSGGESATVGLDAELIQLLDEVTGYQPSRRIISIVGMGGSGKTTLAKNVYENLLIKETFQFRGWATISEQNNAQEILSQLLSGVGEFSNWTVDDLGLHLHKTLACRRYLIVLDDIWSVKAWDEVKRFFPDNKNQSRVLLTSRLSNVAKDCGSSLFLMNLLDEENSWKLFRQKAFQNEDCPPELLEVGEEIVKLCKGLALSIVVIGGLLSKAPRTLGYWKNVANHLKSIPNSKEKQESLDVLTLSYNHLPPHLKPCFLYMGVFKEDSKVRVSKISKLWIAEGFIKPIGSHALEEIAEGYIKDLIDRNLILVGKCHKNGNLGYCGIHDLLRDLCIKIAEQQKLFHVSKVGILGAERRLVDDWCLEPMRVKLPLARSIIARTYTKKPATYRLLRVLDEDYRNPRHDYYKNVNLRYLAFKRPWNLQRVWKLPTSVSLMWNLQTLNIIISDKSLTVVAPTEFWNMRQLRHVECYRIYLPGPPPSDGQDELLMMSNLQTLTTTMNFRLCEEVCNIIRKVKKFHLEYASGLYGYDDGDSLIEIVGYLGGFHKLESLRLTTFGCRPDPGWSKKLTTSFPSSLKKLSLSECRLYWEDLTAIGSLPQLEELKLKIQSCTRGDWSPVDGQFRRLKVLEINYCELVSWDADESHFPILEKLILINLNYLEEIPLGIGDIPTLQLIRVDGCSNSAAFSAMKIREDQVDNDDLQVQIVVIGDHREASLREMAETEGLTIDNIDIGRR